MGWDSEAKLLAIKAIGTVESNLKYDAINYRDPITVGIAQWYGTRAANLLNQIRGTSAWTGVATSLHNDLVANSETNSTFWTGRNLTRAEGESLRGPLTSNIGVQTQNNQLKADLEGYVYQGTRVGISAENNTNAFIYFAAMYHQSPLYARQVAQSAGPNASMDRLHTLALNHSWYSRFPTRQNTVRSIILSGDTSGVPDMGVEPQHPDEEAGGDAGGGIERRLGAITHAKIVGSMLHIYTRNGLVYGYPTSLGDMWTVGAHDQPDSGPEIAPPTQPVDPITPPSSPDVAEQIVQWLIARIEHFTYSQTGNRLNPDVSGYTDCSGLLYAAYRQVAGITLGTWTVDQNRNGREVWRNTPGNRYGAGPGQYPPASLLRKGDLCLFSNDSASNFQRVRHVELFMGADHGNKLIGWGGSRTATPSGRGPYLKNNYDAYMRYYRWHSIRRIL